MLSLHDRVEAQSTLEKCSVKELRRQAALRSVPLTHISAALEKKDLVNLILRAGPVLDQYDVGVKVWSADSIAHEASSGRPKKPKAKKAKKKKRKASSSPSSSSGKKRKRSRSRKAAPKRQKSRSSSLEMIIPTITIGKKDKPVLVIADTSSVAIPSAVNAPVTKRKAAAEEKAAAEKAVTPAARGMAAAAALGYNVLPKGPSLPTSLTEAPAMGLRPSINTGGQVQGIQGLSNARICVNYLSFGRCDMGANCSEAHITDPEEEMRVRAKFKMQECKRGASCLRKNCLFRHPGEIVEENAGSVPSGQGIALLNIDGHLKVTWQ